MLPAYGGVWKHICFYQDDQGKCMPKYIVVLAQSRGGDIVGRLLTSRAALRDATSACSQDETRPGYYLGVINAGVGLGKDSWVDLRGLDDIEPEQWNRLVKAGTLQQVCTLPTDVLCSVLLCAIGAPDTERQQQEAMYGSREALKCTC